MADLLPPEAAQRTTAAVATERLYPVVEDGVARRPRIFAMIENGLDPAGYRERWLNGREPDASPYGFHHAEQLGGEVGFSADRPSRFLGKVVRRLLGFDFLHALYNRHAMRPADILWTMTEREALGICLLMKSGLLPRKPLIGATVWLVNGWYDLPPMRRAFYRWLLRECALVTVHTEPCLARLSTVMPEANAQVLRFGVAADSFRYGDYAVANDAGPIHIVAAGADRTRDWTTLIAAFGNDPRFRLTIICWRLDPADYRDIANLAIPANLSVPEITALYAQADYVAIPMVENIFSGITVAIEAGAMGRPILSTRTGGVPTYFAEDEALYAAPGDPADMRARVLAQDPAARAAMAERGHARFVRDDYSSFGMITRYAGATNALLARAA